MTDKLTGRRVGRIYLVLVPATLVFVVPLAILFWIYQSHTYSGKFLDVVNFSYPVDGQRACEKKRLEGTSGEFWEKTSGGSSFLLKTPVNYRPDYAHPLLVVFASAGMSASLTEKYTGLTRVATESGYIVVYVDSRHMSVGNIIEFGRIPVKVAEKWCIDSSKIFFTGHSDGGTVSHALAFLPESLVTPAAIAPSAAGISGKDLEAYSCPMPASVMVFHGKNDRHFPGFGEEAAAWWAKCNQCESILKAEEKVSGCIVYYNCLGDVEVRYCEFEGNHLDWPRRNRKIVSFFNRQMTEITSDAFVRD